ncbi:MAG: Glu/Leu/Phe/Val dehydrogenase dimerization domain-containing protein [Vicingaceae bacterium]
MLKLLKEYENKRPEIIFEWKDPETEAEGWVVINSLRGGAAGGGTRMRPGLDKHEVTSLAKTMEIKFTVSGPAIGGAKSGINFDPNDSRKEGVLRRWYRAVTPLLKNYYGTGGDLNVDEIHEVIPITESYNVWHPQEGVLTGHYAPMEIEKIHAISHLRQGVSKVIEDPKYSPDPFRKFVVADMITGWGVSEAVRHYYNTYGGKLEGKKALIQGWGNVASAAAFYLSSNGCKIVGILDREGGLMKAEGFEYDEIRQLFLDKKKNKLISNEVIPIDELNNQFWDMEAQVFIPAASSRLITKDQIDRMANAGLEVISCGANVPFADEEIFFGPVAEYADAKVSVLPDFIANCGMARVFAYLMEAKNDLSDKAIFEDVSEIIRLAIARAHAMSNERTGITRSAYTIALKELL